jgi:site-specific DNA recombinase
MKKYFAYVRVSTLRQGDKGVSLPEQRDAIKRYARRKGLIITEWFEERQTAAKRGRPVFDAMLARLKDREVSGVILHKMDRLTRNFRDWADLGEVETEILVATDDIDLSSRSGRLAADIQVVIAADYIRNLREEVRKGFYGRLKQGIYPLAAPIGYLDNGGGKVKTLDPERAALVRSMFEMYATGAFTLKSLANRMRELGLRTKAGRAVPVNRISDILNNPFYVGLIRIKRANELFQGKHEPIIDQDTFDRVQRILRGRTPRRVYRHRFLFPRLIKCPKCGVSLIGERQKSWVYYRCHGRSCRGITIREDRAEQSIIDRFKRIELPKQVATEIEGALPSEAAEINAEATQRKQTLALRLDRANARHSRLTDAMLDGVISEESYKERERKLTEERNAIEQEIRKIDRDPRDLLVKARQNLELWKSVHSSYISGNRDRKRELLILATSNLTLQGKSLAVELSEPFRTFEELGDLQKCGVDRKLGRTFWRFIEKLHRQENE